MYYMCMSLVWYTCILYNNIGHKHIHMYLYYILIHLYVYGIAIMETRDLGWPGVARLQATSDAKIIWILSSLG